MHFGFIFGGIDRWILGHRVEGKPDTPPATSASNFKFESRVEISWNFFHQSGGRSRWPIQFLVEKVIVKLPGAAEESPEFGVGALKLVDENGQDVYDKIAAGACAVQLYTGMIYRGPAIVKDIKKELIEILKKEKVKSIRDIVGINS